MSARSPSSLLVATSEEVCFSSFMGTTLRDRLLEAYAFSTIGAVMLWGAIASFIVATLMSVLVGLGFWHARRTADEERMLAPQRGPGLILAAMP